MDILDNAIIVRNYSDPQNMYGAWNRAKALVDTVQFIEELNAINIKHNLDKDFDALNNWLIVMQSSQRMWQEDCEDLNLDNLAHWLIYESRDESEFRFRLNKIKGLINGFIWNDNVFSSLHSQVLQVTDRLASIIVEWGEDVIKTEARHKAWGIVQYICKWLEDVNSLQKRIQTIIADGEQILNPQPTQTEKEQTEPPRAYNKLLDDIEIKSVFDDIIAMGLMTYRDGFYWWETDNVLLSYLCSQICRYKEFSKQMRDGDYLPNWKIYKGLFMVKSKNGKWIDATDKLGEYKKQYKKNHGGSFNPDGCKQIDEVVSKHPLF